MKSILSLSGRLKKLLARAEEEAQGIVSEAQAKADQMVNAAKEESEKRLVKAQYRTDLGEFLADEEEKAKQEAKKIDKEYAKQAQEIKAFPVDKIKEAAAMVVEEVLQR